MVWISLGIELIMIVLILVSLWIDKRKRKRNMSRKIGLMQMVGIQIVTILPILVKKREKDQMYQIMCTLAGEEEGGNIYAQYRQKRCGLVFGVLLLMNTICLLQMLESPRTEVTFENRQNRPEYGQGTRSQQVTIILEGEEKAEEIIALQIPEKEISGEKAREQVREGLQYVRTMLEGLKVKNDIHFPVEWNGVAFYYESLSPELLSHSGKWMGEIQETSSQIQVKVTAVMGEERETEVICLSTVATKDLSSKEKLKLLVKKIEEGSYLTENEIILPEATEEGERLTWIQTEDSKEGVWILLGVILLIFVLWQQDQKYKTMLKERERKTRQSYPEFMNELVILVGAGLSLPAAWKRIGQDYQKKKKETGELDPLYEEIYEGSCEMEAGTSMREVLEAFAVHMRFKEARRFAVLLAQNLKRGDAFLVNRLKELNQEAWEVRKKQVREKTEEADTKLLLPLILMLVVILIIVLSPAMITMQM